MALPKLDGAGIAKMEVLEEATNTVQRMHGIVERMAVAVRSQQDTSTFGAQLRRTGQPLVGLLRGQFGLISDLVAALLLSSTRGGGEQNRLRTMREGVAQIRTQVELAVAGVRAKHTIEEPKAPTQ
jgi:hypothetical protein